MEIYRIVRLFRPASRRLKTNPNLPESLPMCQPDREASGSRENLLPLGWRRSGGRDMERAVQFA